MTTVLPIASGAGGEICSGAFIGALRRAGHRVVVVGYHRRGDSRVSQRADDIAPATRSIESRNAGLRPAVWMASALLRREPYSVAKFRSRPFRAQLTRILAEENPDVVVLDHAQMAWALPTNGFGVPLVFIAHNVEHSMYRRAAAHRGGLVGQVLAREARRMEVVERRVVRSAGGAWALSQEDAAELNSCGAGSTRVFEVPPSASVGAALVDIPAAYDVGIIGSWTWGPNAAGLKWFVEQVNPLLPSDLSVAVAGGGGQRMAGDLDYRGRVPDADAFLRAARVVACPSVQGGGVQFKTLDAIATGRPVVATSVALRGLPDPPPTVVTADDAAAFAAALVAAVADGAPKSDVARQWVEDRRNRFEREVSAALADAVRR